MKNICKFCKKEYEWKKGLSFDFCSPTHARAFKQGKVFQEEHFFCLICGKEIKKGRQYCSKSCQVKSQHKNGYHKSPFLNKEIREKAKQTILSKYGVCNVFLIENIHKKAFTKEAKEKRIKHYKENMLKKAGVEWNSQLLEVKKHISEKVNTEEAKIKANITKKENGTYGKSKDEEKIAQLLHNKFGKIERQYSSEAYPFPCDFYIPSLDIYIEYQGFWTHGREPYNKNNQKHIEKLELWKNREKTKNTTKGIGRKNSYTNAIHVWTVSDPLKRKIAKENNLNWKEFWSVNEVEEWLKTIK